MFIIVKKFVEGIEHTQELYC